jgi:hypothetical protein
VVRNQRHGLRETIASRRIGPCLTCACLFVLVVCGTSVVLPLRPAIAAPQDETAAQSTSPALQDTSAQEQAEYNGQDFTRPQNLLQLRYEYTTAPGKTRQVTTDTIALRADKKIDLSPQWQLALRSDLLVRAKDPITSDNPDGHFLYGLGDTDVQAGLIYTFNARWAAGFGDRLIAPTGPDSLGSGKWQMMPIVGVRDKLPEISPDSYFTFLVRYDVSVAGDPSRKNISNLQFAPTLNLDLPDRWFITFYPNPDIRINFGDPVTGQTGRLFLPFDVLVGRKLTTDWVASLEVSVPMINDYPVYNFKTEARLNLSY